MVDAREIIARAAESRLKNDGFASYDEMAAHLIDTLTASGVRLAGPNDRILGPDEVDQVTLEQAAALCLSASIEATNPSRACQADELGEAIRAIGRKA